MILTQEEKVKISFIFISAYENLLELIRPFQTQFNKQLTAKDGNVITSAMQKEYSNLVKSNKTLSMEDTYDLLVKLDFLDKNDLDIFRQLKLIRNDIGHRSMSIYFDENFDFKYFRLNDLFQTYINIYKKVTSEFINDNPSETKECLHVYNLNYISLVIMVDELLKDTKFSEIKKYLEEHK